MPLQIDLILPPFSDKFVNEFLVTTREIFSDESDDWYESRKWRLENMPDVACFAAYNDHKMIAFKAGYATTYNLYYSWLGGVVPEFRNKGIATQLMLKQHEWLETTRFKTVETHVEQANKSMIQINQKCGLDIIGLYMSNKDPYFIMRKKFEK